MSYKNKKLSPSKYKGRGVLLYQNLWHKSKLTKKRVKLSKYKVKVHSTELGRPLSKYRTLQTIVCDPITNFNNNERYIMFVLGTKKFTNNNKTLFFYKFSKKHTKENFKDESNNQKNFKIFYSDNSMCSTALFKGSKFRVKKNLRIMVKRLWFFDKAAPIPGVSSLKKKKRLLSTKYRAFKNIQRLYEIYNKKKIKAFFRLQKKREFSKNWAAILLMESMYQRSFKKRAFTYNSHQRYKLAYSQYTTINGSFVKKLCFVNMRGDFTLTKNVYTTLNILLSFYATKKPFFLYSCMNKNKK